MRYARAAILAAISGMLLCSCSALFDPGSGGFKITSMSVEPNPVRAGQVAVITVTGEDARKGLHDCMWPNTLLNVSNGNLYYSLEEAQGGEAPFGWQQGGGKNIECMGNQAWWVAPAEPQIVTINANFGGATRTITVEVITP